MRRGAGISLVLVCVCLCSCGDARLECGAGAVKGTVASLVRERFVRVAGDAYPSPYDASRRAWLGRATRVTTLEPRLVEWDAATGQLTCVARIVVEAPEPASDTSVRREAELRYRVTHDAGETFFVEVAYAELMALTMVRQASGRESRRAP
jgi:hypothetical protein